MNEPGNFPRVNTSPVSAGVMGSVWLQPIRRVPRTTTPWRRGRSPRLPEVERARELGDPF
jgi:hypothetical protein